MPASPPDPSEPTAEAMLLPHGGTDSADESWRASVPRGGLAVQAIATVDLGLRTALAGLVAATAAPATISRKSAAAQRKAINFFAELSASGADAASLFPPPPLVKVEVRQVGRRLWAPGVARMDSLSFKSPYQVTCPDLEESYAAHRRNTVARALHWRHPDGPRPTIVVVHGFTGSPYWLNSTFFSLPWFYGHGCDVVLVILPFHGPRNDRPAPFSGSGMFSSGLGLFHEAMFQSVCDIRVIVDYLLGSGVDHVGVTGLSLGGYVTALLAETDPRLHVAIPNAAVTDFSALLDGWFPAGQLLALGLRQAGIGEQEFRTAMRLHSPLRHPSVLDRSRLLIIGGLGDRLAPPEQSSRLHDHWGRPRIHWFPGSHILHVGRASYLREVGRFLRATGFSPG